MSSSAKRALRAALATVLGLSAVALFVLSCVPDSFVQRIFVSLIRYVAHSTSRTSGSFLFVGLYVLTISLMLPGSPLNLAAGFIFDFILGSVVSVAGITLGAISAFLLGRTLMRSWAQSKMASYPRFRAIDRAVADNGFALVFLLRLSPLMPFPLLCYLLGATRLPLLTYVVSSLCGLLPGTVAYCYLGTLLSDLSSIWTTGSGNKFSRTVWIIVVGVTTVLLLVFITYITKRALDSAMLADQAGRGEDEDFEAGSKVPKSPAIQMRSLGRVEPIVSGSQVQPASIPTDLSLRPFHSSSV